MKLIKNDFDLNSALERVNTLWGAEPDTEEGDELELLALLIEKYEDEHYPVLPSDPIEAIKFALDQRGLTAKDLGPYIGTRSRVFEVMTKRRPLSLEMIKRLHSAFKIPYERLII